MRAMNCSEMALDEERKMLRTNDTGQMFAAPQRCNPEFRGESDALPTVSYQSFGRKDPDGHSSQSASGDVACDPPLQYSHADARFALPVTCPEGHGKHSST